jgi:hypothetical protein
MEAYSFYSTIQVSQLDSDISQAKVLLDSLNATLQNLQQFKGDTGENGKTVLSGTINPLSTTGTIDDLYLNTSSWDMFKKTTDTVWTLQGNIKGAVPNAVTYGTRTRFGGGVDDTVNMLQVNGGLSVNDFYSTSRNRKHSISSSNINETTLTITVNGDHRYLAGFIEIYYSNIFASSPQPASRKYILNFVGSNLGNQRSLSEIGTGFGTALTLSNFATVNLTGTNNNFIFTITFPAGGYPLFIFDASFNTFNSPGATKYTTTLS